MKRPVHGQSVVDRPIVLVGNATQDTAFFVPHLPAEDEVCPVQEVVRCLGGRGVVPSLVAAALGLQPDLCTVIGHDVREEFTLFLEANRVGISAVKWDKKNRGVTQYVAFVAKDSGTSVAVAKAADLDWTSTEEQRNLVRRARAVYFSTNNLNFNLQLLDCVSDDAFVIHNLGIRITDNPGYLNRMIRTSAILIGNRVELSNLVQACRLTLQEIFASSESLKNIIVTAGREGVQVFGRDQPPVTYSPQAVRQVRSPVGAGDSFAMGILWAAVSNSGLRKGIDLGMALGALAVGSERSYPDLAQVSRIPR